MTILQSLRIGALCAVLTPGFALAADQPVVNEKFSDLEPAIQMLRQEVGKDRRAIVKANMLLTESEAARFWPLYDEYRGEMVKQGDRRVKLITDYAANRDSMSEDEANRILKERLECWRISRRSSARALASECCRSVSLRLRALPGR